MKSDGKNESLLFGLFSRSKAAQESKAVHDEQIQAPPPQVANAAVENPAAEKTVEPIAGFAAKQNNLKWNAVKLATFDERCEYMRIWTDSTQLYAKMERREYLPPQSTDSLPQASADTAEPGTAATEAQAQPNGETAQIDSTSAQDIDTQALFEEEEEEPLPDWDMEFLQTVLTDLGINTGVDEAALELILAPTYEKEIVFAIGTPAVNGEDAVITENYSRETKPHFETRPDGSIDFKNMHLVTIVDKGAVICEMTAPTPGTEGISVFGEKLMPKPGNKLILTRGENTETLEVDETHTQLVATCSGSLVFRKDRFCVDNVYKIEGNVDNGTGNVDFVGNIIVTGDVLEGYSIKTEGSITVFGMVEGASLYAGGDIHIEKGINGMGKGILQANGEITAKFIENCNVICGGNLASESIINSKIECDANIKVTGKGLITGGKITDFGSIEAKVIGSNSSTPTTIILGSTPSILRERNEVEAQFKEVDAQYSEAKKSIAYLGSIIASGKNADEAAKLLASLNGKLSILTLKKQRVEKRRDEIAAEILDVGNSTLTCSTIYPPARITIGSSNMVIKETYNNCRFYRNSDGEISVGMK